MREEFLTQIRQLKGFERAVLPQIEVDKRTQTVTFFLVTDVTYTADDHRKAEEIATGYIPQGMHAAIAVSKFVADEDATHARVLNLIGNISPIAAAFVRPQDVQVVKDGYTTRFCLDVTAYEKRALNIQELIDSITKELTRTYCGTYIGTYRETVKEEVKVEEAPVEEESEPQFAPRFFPIENYSAIDGGEKPTMAMYIADCNGEAENVTICGKIIRINEKETGKGKPFFSFYISDGTANMRVTYFSKQATIDKIRDLKEGDHIVCSGANELYNGNLSYQAKKINRGGMPENFVPEERPMREAPAAYHTVFPEPYHDFSQTDMFTHSVLPDDLTNHTFVVFDLETTGLNNVATGGVMDSIIEFGAVKIVNGEIKEKFSTFVAYEKKLSAEIVKLTGITDDMLVGAPTIDKVIPDFYKFCNGCLLVGHNVTFDYRFVEHYAKKERYSFGQMRYDTLTIAQEILRLSNYKLNTIADYYGITFNHHRAFDDALTTAKIFIELIKERKALPKA